MNKKIAQITASAILLLTTNSLPSNAVNSGKYLVADAANSPTVTNQVTDDNIKPLVEKQKPKPRLIEKLPINPQPPRRPVPDKCRRRVWNWRLRRWVYINIRCDKKRPSGKQILSID
ncbi:MAG: hypothetical protein KI793_23795 [Rivularia sp. (in: Bacteria)]|nr:hypothetical protein [Rivularia sp. MS3]